MSLKQIAARLDIAKSTVSLWLRDMPSAEAAARGLVGNRDIGNRTRERALANQQRWAEEAEARWSEYVQDPLFTMGLGLYWGEGAKTDKTLSITNSDPALIRVWMSWCRKFMPGIRQRVRITAHLDVDAEAARDYWKRVTGAEVAEKVTRINTRKKDSTPTRICVHGTVRVIPIGHPSEWFVKVMYWLGKSKRTWCNSNTTGFHPAE